jgi:CheY-like chemotaxis protein
MSAKIFSQIANYRPSRPLLWWLTPHGQGPAQPAVTVTRTNPPLADLRKKILIVDDDAVIVATTSAKLRSRGYEVVTAVDASEAISSVRLERPDLILLDISFPPDVAHGGTVAWDGFSLMQWLRGLEETRNTPFVIITGDRSEEYQKRARSSGATAFFQKPIEHDSLFTVIENALTKSTVAQQQRRDFQI